MSTTTPGQGHKGGLITLGKEATYNGGASPQHKFEVIDFDFTPNKIEVDDENLTGFPEVKDTYLGGYSVSGVMTLRCNFDGLLEILRGCHGSYSQAVVGGETIVRDHTYKTGDQLPSYSMDVFLGDVPTGKVWRFDGVKFLGYDFDIDLTGGKYGTMKIAFFAANMLTDQTQRTVSVSGCSTATNTNLTRAAGDWNADIRPGMSVTGTNIQAGTTVLSITSATVCVLSLPTTGTTGSLTMTFSPNVPSNFPVMGRMTNQTSLATWADGTGDALGNVRLRSVSISYQQPHDTNRFYGALNPDEPLRDGWTIPKITVMQEFLTKSAYDQHKAHTYGALVLQFQDPTTIGTASKREWEFKLPRASMSQPKSPINGPGKIIQTSEWRGFRDSTLGAAIVLRVRNTEVALV